MSSMGTPELDRSEMKLWRSSRGVHSPATGPDASATGRNARRTLAASSSVPNLGKEDPGRLGPVGPAGRGTIAPLGWMVSEHSGWVSALDVAGH